MQNPYENIINEYEVSDKAEIRKYFRKLSVNLVIILKRFAIK
jgi:hypothetical protein